MKLERVTIENYRAIERLELLPHPQLTVLHGDNGHGKTRVLSAIAMGLSSVPRFLPGAMYDSDREHYLENDPRGLNPARVSLATIDGITWERHSCAGPFPRDLRNFIDEIVAAEDNGDPPIALPIVAFYDTDRAVIGDPEPDKHGRLHGPYPRHAALDGALSARTDFRSFFDWFYDRENDEVRRQRELRSFDYRAHELEAVRRAITAMVPGVSEPRMEIGPTRFIVSVESESGEIETLALDRLSGGYRIMLALVADLARRMAQGNPHLDDPLQSEAIVLIDEVDLHLHPSWQQRVLPDLMRTFPNAQFIVSTHSPQVLTTVKPEHIVELTREGDGIVAYGPGAPTYGAEAGYVLSTVMGVKERPSGEHNEFVATLERYNDLVYAGQGESEEALTLRKKLESLSPRDLALGRADSEMRRQKVMERLGRTK